ncbi:beta-lactamase-like protein [Thamnocephalis sphaerospora]|uniref:hydroxyacylglutathione hydrolase n=1 Tax=Thamnocephalis sphaerospora TaxID=78915 RepID=A0A4P9XKD4_9FUNG|nr:beta-lactamase-like protein [Thamnocephalis sphaerospora]|eukprot:RKP05871.1 beta-lactamase-like protein [Thamnocephalis sphaerospora]
MKVVPVKCLSDNYAYLLIDPATQQAAAVDPVQPERVLQAVREHQCRLTTVLTTHHHADHAGGNEELVKHRTNLHVYGGDARIPAATHSVQDGDTFTVGELQVCVLATPCHTSGHICYYVTDPNASEEQEKRAVFTGDTLFVGGCGRFFEGTATQMLAALDKLGALPTDTRVYCGHEYTRANLQFALAVDADNEKVRFAESTSCTVPSTIASELACNPFMRTREPALQQATGKQDAVQVMAELREQKNRFRG